MLTVPQQKSLDGTNKTGYAVVTHFSTQAAELIALIRACELMNGKSVTIYMDSQNVYSTLCVCQPVETLWNGNKYRQTSYTWKIVTETLASNITALTTRSL